ncbi:MAG TPA: CoA-binding protein [Stellaceae bacterium]|nr:CoA-binding protein [Stellaceae bacterium]
MSAFFAPETPVIVQGMTGRVGRAHTANMRAYGTNVVGGVSPNGTELDGLPIFRDCAAAVAATGAIASVLVVPPLSLLQAIEEALDGGIRFLVSVAEGMPVHDALKALAAVRAAGARWIGPSTPGMAIPGRVKLGFLPSVSLAPGSLGLMSKSGTLSYEVGYRLVQRGLGQSLWVGVGGDSVKGTRFADMVPVFEADPGTSAMVVIGEIGGSEEEELAEALLRYGARKPVYALIAGQTAREGVTMGHAGALVSGDTGTVATKTAALVGAGARVFTRIQDLVDAVAAAEKR